MRIHGLCILVPLALVVGCGDRYEILLDVDRSSACWDWEVETGSLGLWIAEVRDDELPPAGDDRLMAYFQCLPVNGTMTRSEMLEPFKGVGYELDGFIPVEAMMVALMIYPLPDCQREEGATPLCMHSEVFGLVGVPEGGTLRVPLHVICPWSERNEVCKQLAELI